MSEVAPVRREVMVAVDAARAFALFTDRIGAWWPVDRLSVLTGEVAFEGDELVERLGDRSAVWAEVREWDPPRRVRLNWHPGGSADSGTDVEITFIEQDGQTLVRLAHSGWERHADPAAAAEEYGHGWPLVLDEYAGEVARAEAPDRWFALVHRPGPAMPAGESIFAQPAFAEHLAFIARLAERGLLVAAGPMLDENGAGMTVVRVRPEHGEVDVEALARTDDQCVAQGFLTVTARPWQVVLTG
ncbi:SRPBCC domain-containing protein [uncultured Jatrophihabitans sp.]|uniref:SRPBCC domain-containing protein n=1 Tax=uncultured Jatrophihabitans sp. TaxID=1610747 RepID=UPI0035CA8D18